MPLPPHVQAYLDSDEFKREKEEFDAWVKRIDELSEPIIDAVDWHLLEFTDEAMEIQRGDPEIAFQCEWDGWVIRSDFSSEIGDSSWYWKKGCEQDAVDEWGDTEMFAHGTPVRPITLVELDLHEWHLRSAIRGFVAHLINTAQVKA